MFWGLYYQCDLPQMENITVATFVDDTTIVTVDNDIEEDTENQVYTHKLCNNKNIKNERTIFINSNIAP